MRNETAKFWELAEPYVKDAGYEISEVQWNREPGGWILRIFIDIDPDTAGVDAAAAAVGHADCERVSRDVSAALDAADAVPHAYQLEVSSPGLDRPLRREKDFARFAGRNARVRLMEGVDGRRNFTGKLLGAAGGVVDIECDGRAFRVLVRDVAKAHLIPDWDQEFHRSAS